MAEPMSKAQRILGSAPLAIDNSRQFNKSSGPVIKVTESAELDSGATRWSHRQGQANRPRSDDGWGNESAIIPHGLNDGSIEGSGDANSYASDASRMRESTSSIDSWYDKNKMPLVLSQQTSASAMAKGLPNKAHRLLDINNSNPPPVNRSTKMPPKLDFSSLRGSKRTTKGPQAGLSPGLPPNDLTRSTSLAVPVGPDSPRLRRKLQKRSTAEDLAFGYEPSDQSLQSQSSERPAASAMMTHRTMHSHHDELPDLYQHYEQTSFRDVTAAEQATDEQVQQVLLSKPGNNSAFDHSTTHPVLCHELDATETTSHGRQDSQNTVIYRPDGREAGATSRGSRGSRGTRVSKRSIVAARVQAPPDFQDRSVLILSSDSEEEIAEPLFTKSKLHPAKYLPTNIGVQHELEQPLMDTDFSSISRSTLSTQSRSSKSTKSVESTGSSIRHLSTSKSTNMILPCYANTTPPSLVSDTNEIFQQNILTDSLESTSSKLAIGTNMARSNLSSFKARPTRAVTFLPAQGPSDYYTTDESEEEPTLGVVSKRHHELGALLHTDAAIRPADSLTPPLSPRSVEFEKQPNHSSTNGSSGQNRYMAVTHQEEMLLAALRQKRMMMRKNVEPTTTKADFTKSPASDHQYNDSVAAVTDTSFDFNFPTPPRSGRPDSSVPNAQQVDVLPPGSSCSSDEDTFSDLFPAPSSALPRTVMSFRASENFADYDRESYIDIEDEYDEQSPNVDDANLFLGESEWAPKYQTAKSSPAPGRELLSPVWTTDHSGPRISSRPQQQARDSVRSGTHRATRKSASATLNSGIPRPDSPVSSEVFLPKPSSKTRANRKTPRLSAVGLGRTVSSGVTYSIFP